MSTCCDWARSYSDWPVDTMAAICQAESGGNASVVNPSGCCVGLGQVNVFAHTQYSAADMTDPAKNAAASHAIWQSQGLSAWETYTSGAYRQYLGACGGSASPIALPDLGTTVGSSVAGVSPGALVLLGVGAVALLVGAESLGDLA